MHLYHSFEVVLYSCYGSWTKLWWNPLLSRWLVFRSSGEIIKWQFWACDRKMQRKNTKNPPAWESFLTSLWDATIQWESNNDTGVDVLCACVWHSLFLRLLIIDIRAPGRVIISSQFHRNKNSIWEKKNPTQFAIVMQNILPDVSVCGIACLLSAHCQKTGRREH